MIAYHLWLDFIDKLTSCFEKQFQSEVGGKSDEDEEPMRELKKNPQEKNNKLQWWANSYEEVVHQL